MPLQSRFNGTERWMVMGMSERCLHNEVCKYGEKRSNGMYCTEEKCKQFKNRTKYVEVVRCKDCKWYDRNEDIMPQSGSCGFHEMVKMDWDFCSRAKMDGDGNGDV